MFFSLLLQVFPSQAQVVEHAFQKPRPDIFFRVFYDGHSITEVKGAVAAFASFVINSELDPSIFCNPLELFDQFVTVHGLSVGQFCPKNKAKMSELWKKATDHLENFDKRRFNAVG